MKRTRLLRYLAVLSLLSPAAAACSQGPAASSPDAGGEGLVSADVFTLADTVADTAADTAVDTATDTATDAAADTAVDTVADTATDTATDTAADTAVDTDTDTATDTAVDTVADTATDTAADTAVDTAADTAVDTAADTAVDTAADTAVDTAADTAVDTATDTAADTATDTAADTVADTAEDTASDTGPDVPPTPTCAEYVVMDAQGRFRLDGQPYQLKGINLHMQIGAVVTNADQPGLAPADYEWDYFVAPYGNYSPKNYGLCSVPWANPSLCCHDEASCREMVAQQHIERVVALGANSVRLIDMGVGIADDGHPYARCVRRWDAYSQGDQDAGLSCQLDLTDPTTKARYFEVVRDAIRLLGQHGLRTILLTGGKNADDGANHYVYVQLLSELAQALADEPWLLAYDPFNEPVYAYRTDLVSPEFLCAGGQFCKDSVRDISKGWFDALTGSDPNHFVTVGEGTPTLSIINWDPAVLYDHFTSWHIYPTRPWDEGAVPHGRRGLSREVYVASLNACGRPCPYGGEDDGLGCRVAVGPVTDSGFTYQGGFYVAYQPQGDPCPVGYDDGAHCRVGSFEPGRDVPFILRQPLYYLTPQGPAGDECPPGTTLDGTGCLMAEGPVGASAFLYDPGSGPHFYWSLMDGEPPCASPASYDGANCLVGAAPDGWEPFLAQRPYFYVQPVSCWPRKPAHMGETGFSVFPNGQDLELSHYQGNASRLKKYHECVDDAGSLLDDVRPAGTEDEQVGFLLGDPEDSWPGLFPYTQACGFQGMHWWALGTVNWGICREDNFGFYAFWYLYDDVPPGGDELALVPRAGAVAFHDGVDFLAPAQQTCDEPEDLRLSPRRGDGPPHYRFIGRVVDGAGAPVPLAMFYAWDADWSGPVKTFTDAQGYFALERPDCLVKGGATAFGWGKDVRWLSGQCPTPPGGGSGVTDVALGNFVIEPRGDLPGADALHPPSARHEVCLSPVGVWEDAL